MLMAVQGATLVELVWLLVLRHFGGGGVCDAEGCDDAGSL